MKELKSLMISFLLRTAIPNKEFMKRKEYDRLYSVIWRAHRDVLTGRWHLPNYTSVSNDVIEELYDYIVNCKSELTSQKLIAHLDETFPDETIEFGAKQKLANMTLKYIIILNEFDDEFKKAGKKVDITNCDCPLDSIILSKLNRYDVKWTSISRNEYEEIQNEITTILQNNSNDITGNIYYDFENWNH